MGSMIQDKYISCFAGLQNYLAVRYKQVTFYTRHFNISIVKLLIVYTLIIQKLVKTMQFGFVQVVGDIDGVIARQIKSLAKSISLDIECDNVVYQNIDNVNNDLQNYDLIVYNDTTAGFCGDIALGMKARRFIILSHSIIYLLLYIHFLMYWFNDTTVKHVNILSPIKGLLIEVHNNDTSKSAQL